MSDRLALLEQRVADLELESAALMSIITFLMGQNPNGEDVEAWAASYEAAAARWGELTPSEIGRTATDIIGASLRHGGRPLPSQR